MTDDNTQNENPLTNEDTLVGAGVLAESPGNPLQPVYALPKELARARAERVLAFAETAEVSPTDLEAVLGEAGISPGALDTMDTPTRSIFLDRARRRAQLRGSPNPYVLGKVIDLEREEELGDRTAVARKVGGEVGVKLGDVAAETARTIADAGVVAIAATVGATAGSARRLGQHIRQRTYPWLRDVAYPTAVDNATRAYRRFAGSNLPYAPAERLPFEVKEKTPSRLLTYTKKHKRKIALTLGALTAAASLAYILHSDPKPENRFDLTNANPAAQVYGYTPTRSELSNGVPVYSVLSRFNVLYNDKCQPASWSDLTYDPAGKGRIFDKQPHGKFKITKKDRRKAVHVVCNPKE